MFAVFGLGHWEIIAILVVALLLFGRRLPEVARNLGKGIVEFKKGVRGIEDDVEQGSTKRIENPSQDYTYERPATPVDAKADHPPRDGQD
ncbi:MAG: twin-arginine translocase TatA/TatE family subunit [Planctomycetes bacterium]|nr:twin-arginine translocase TatA/TatE family subunit [Planctomycetota bacterium]